MIESYLNIFLTAVFVENMALAFFLGMCTFLAVAVWLCLLIVVQLLFPGLTTCGTEALQKGLFRTVVPLHEELAKGTLLGILKQCGLGRSDLEDLLNTASRTESDGVTLFEHVRSSVLNFGIPDLCGQTLSGLSEGDLERAVRDAVLRYEPRILSQSLSVQVVHVTGSAPGRSSLALEISGELWAMPTPDPLFFRTEVDLETGQFSIKDRSHG